MFCHKRTKENPLESRFLESLLYVAKHGSIAAAARRQGLTPAAVGQRIHALEVELGFSLVERVGHRSRPTAACLRMLPHARALVEQAQQLSEKADAQGLSGSLRVGFISTLFHDIVPLIMRDVNNQLPGLRLHLVPGTSKELYAALSEDEIDIVMIVEPPFVMPKEITLIPLLREPFVLVSKLHNSRSIARSLTSMPYLRYDPNSWGGMIAERYLEEAGLKPDPICDLDSPETLAILVSEGMGVSLIPRWKGFDRFSGALHVSKFLPAKFDRHICLAMRTTPRREPLTAFFKDVVFNAARSL